MPTLPGSSSRGDMLRRPEQSFFDDWRNPTLWADTGERARLSTSRSRPALMRAPPLHSKGLYATAQTVAGCASGPRMAVVPYLRLGGGRPARPRFLGRLWGGPRPPRRRGCPVWERGREPLRAGLPRRGG